MAYPMEPRSSLLLPPGQIHLTGPSDTLFMRSAREISQHMQVPIDMVMYALLSVISTSCQGRHRLALPNSQTKQISLAILIIVASGGRKSTLLKLLLAALLKVEREERKERNKRMEEYETELAEWDAERQGLLRAIKREHSKGLPVGETKHKLDEHKKIRPTKPRRFRLAFEDATDASLFTHLAKEMPSASLITAEGKTLFDSAMFKAFGKLNALLSGDRTTVDRVNQPPLELDDVSLGLLAMTQPGVLQSHLESRGEEMREAGFYARLLVIQPLPLSGQRFLDPNAPHPIWEAWREAERRLETLARENRLLLTAPDTEPMTHSFSDEAALCWIQYYNEIEAENRPGGRFEHSQDHAGKLAEMAARVSANLHLFEGHDGPITTETLLQAIDLCNWSSVIFHEVFQPIPQVCRDAQQLNNWLQGHRNRGVRCLTRTWVRQRCPNPLRNRDRLLAAIEELQAHGQVMQFVNGKTTVLDLTPCQPFAPQPQAQTVPSAGLSGVI
nr:YfjI family protein [Halomonas socia]